MGTVVRHSGRTHRSLQCSPEQSGGTRESPGGSDNLADFLKVKHKAHTQASGTKRHRQHKYHCEDRMMRQHGRRARSETIDRCILKFAGTRGIGQQVPTGP